jgi:hypothetical protein
MKVCHICHRVHKNMSIFVIRYTNVWQCHRVHKNLPFYVIVSTKISQCLSSYPQKSVNVFIVSTEVCQCFHRVHKNLSVFDTLSTEICQCFHRVHRNLSMFSSCPQKSVNVCQHVHKNLPLNNNRDTSQHYRITFRIKFLSLWRFPSGFSNQILFYNSFFSLSTYPFLLNLIYYIAPIMLAQ